MKQIECNNCGSGKKLYFMVRKNDGTFTMKEYERQKVETKIEYGQFRCPSCGSEDYELIL